MKKNVSPLIMLLLLIGCSKSDDYDIGSPRCNAIYNRGYFLNRAQEFAYHTWGGEAKLLMDTFYFSYTKEADVPDSIPYRKEVLNGKANEAWQYVFEPVKFNKLAWQYFWFQFNAKFTKDNTDTTIRFLYPLDNETIFYFQ